MHQEEMDVWEKHLGDFFKKHTMAEIQSEAVKRQIHLGVSNNPQSITRNEQLHARNYWVEASHPDFEQPITYPGTYFKIADTPWKLARSAPQIGEHNEEVYIEELGLPQEEFIALREKNVI